MQIKRRHNTKTRHYKVKINVRGVITMTQAYAATANSIEGAEPHTPERTGANEIEQLFTRMFDEYVAIAWNPSIAVDQPVSGTEGLPSFRTRYISNEEIAKQRRLEIEQYVEVAFSNKTLRIRPELMRLEEMVDEEGLIDFNLIVQAATAAYVADGILHAEMRYVDALEQPAHISVEPVSPEDLETTTEFVEIAQRIDPTPRNIGHYALSSFAAIHSGIVNLPKRIANLAA
jgi:hypothetical protein